MEGMERGVRSSMKYKTVRDTINIRKVALALVSASSKVCLFWLIHNLSKGRFGFHTFLFFLSYFLRVGR